MSSQAQAVCQDHDERFTDINRVEGQFSVHYSTRINIICPFVRRTQPMVVLEATPEHLCVMLKNGDRQIAVTQECAMLLLGAVTCVLQAQEYMLLYPAGRIA